MSDQALIPKHVAIIMDGNGRWAKEKNLPRSYGHREGVKRVKEIVRAAAELGVSFITLFAFSSENWKRPRKEIDMLMRYLDNFLIQQVNEMHKNNIRFKVIGGGRPLPVSIQKKIHAAESKTRNNKGLTVILALNYGSRQEIVEAAKALVSDVVKGDISVSDIDVDKFNQYLYTAGLPNPDLLIRTSGEMRISNFLLWQLSYAELYFTKKFWPDFKAGDFKKAIDEYKTRERRFGGV
ncbi:MAG: isoprenyl transferase [Candidatus Omnitrophica bacterium]|nr:isoprenyl transferase [Candidatus Omnitrophota bacterium]